jgi:hypothetical protein
VKAINNKYVRDSPSSEYEQPLEVYESFFDMYAKNKNVKKADAVRIFIFPTG